MLAFGAPGSGLIDIPITFLLKNKLHLKAHELADFRLVSAIPLYLSFAFGFIRDTWNPFGMRDRGFMLLFGALTASLYILFAFTPLTYGTLLAAVLVLTASFLFVASAQNGLTSTLGQQHAMSGQISAVWNIFADGRGPASGWQPQQHARRNGRRSGCPNLVSHRCRDNGLNRRLRAVEAIQRV
jgi:hypothetical protein